MTARGTTPLDPRGAPTTHGRAPEPWRQVQPYRLVSWQRRWYLVGRTMRTDSWSTYRLDWMRLRTPGGPRFTPVELPGGDYTAFVLREVAFAGWSVEGALVEEEILRAGLAPRSPSTLTRLCERRERLAA